MPTLKKELDELARVGQAGWKIVPDEKEKTVGLNVTQLIEMEIPYEAFQGSEKKPVDTGDKIIIVKSEHKEFWKRIREKEAAEQKLAAQRQEGKRDPKEEQQYQDRIDTLQGELEEIHETEIIPANRVQQLLVERGVDTRFLETFLSSNDQGVRISLAPSEGSLAEYLEKNTGKLTRGEIKDIFGQIALGLLALHDANLVHRNLSGENISLTRLNDRPVVKIGGLDIAVPVQANGSIIGDPNQFTMARGAHRYPLFSLQVEKAEATRDSKRKMYAKLDLRKEDCYALGCILDHLIEAAKKDTIPEGDSIHTLKNALLTQHPGSSPLSVQQIMEHEFFSQSGRPAQENEEEEKKEEQSAFFQQLKANVPTVLLGGHTARASKVNDNFLLLDNRFKPIYELARQLDLRFDDFDAFDRDKNLSLGVCLHELDGAPMKGFHQHLLEFNKEFKALAESKLTDKQRKALDTLGIRVDEKLKEIYSKQEERQFKAIQQIVELSYQEYRATYRGRSFLGRLFSHQGGVVE